MKGTARQIRSKWDRGSIGVTGKQGMISFFLENFFALTKTSFSISGDNINVLRWMNSGNSELRIH